MDSETRVILNVGGERHEVFKQILKKLPNSRLSRLTPCMPNYDALLKEFFFDRHPGMFGAILNYYRTGKLHYPIDVCGPIFEEELEYWGVDSNEVEPCCWLTYTNPRDTKKTLAVIETLDTRRSSATPTVEETAYKFGWSSSYHEGKLSIWQGIKPKLYSLFDEPWTSHSAKAVQIISISSILISVVCFCVKTDKNLIEPVLSANFTLADWQKLPEWNRAETSLVLGICIYAELATHVWFTLELFIRAAVCPNLAKFARNSSNFIDVIATLLYWTEISFAFINAESTGVKAFLNVIGMASVLRLFKLTDHSVGLKIVIQTFKKSFAELLLLVFFVTIGMVIFATLAFYTEQLSIDSQSASTIADIPTGIWYSIVTMCTIGYGDKVPKTAMGMVIGSVSAIMGVLVIALPLPILVNNFSMIYTHYQARSQLPTEKRHMKATDEATENST